MYTVLPTTPPAARKKIVTARMDERLPECAELRERKVLLITFFPMLSIIPVESSRAFLVFPAKMPGSHYF